MLGKEHLRTAFRDVYLKIFLVVSLLFVALNIALIIWKALPLAEIKPIFALHYNVFFGVDEIGKWQRIFIFPGLGLAVWVLNAILALWYYATERFASYALLITSVGVNLALFFATMFTILANL
ncbi:MAG: hypothetical protein V1821_03125 [bacterium]